MNKVFEIGKIYSALTNSGNLAGFGVTILTRTEKMAIVKESGNEQAVYIEKGAENEYFDVRDYANRKKRCVADLLWKQSN